MVVNWGRVRQIMLNDRINGYKPDRNFLNKLARVLPDCKVLGFGPCWEKHWYVLVESQAFPETDDDFGVRGLIPFTSIIQRQQKSST